MNLHSQIKLAVEQAIEKRFYFLSALSAFVVLLNKPQRSAYC